jgi:hypothetical protein
MGIRFDSESWHFLMVFMAKNLSEKELSVLSDYELQSYAREHLITPDGRDKKVKNQILNEIISRWSKERNAAQLYFDQFINRDAV